MSTCSPVPQPTSNTVPRTAPASASARNAGCGRPMSQGRALVEGVQLRPGRGAQLAGRLDCRADRRGSRATVPVHGSSEAPPAGGRCRLAQVRPARWAVGPPGAVPPRSRPAASLACCVPVGPCLLGDRCAWRRRYGRSRLPGTIASYAGSFPREGREGGGEGRWGEGGGRVAERKGVRRWLEGWGGLLGCRARAGIQQRQLGTRSEPGAGSRTRCSRPSTAPPGEARRGGGQDAPGDGGQAGVVERVGDGHRTRPPQRRELLLVQPRRGQQAGDQHDRQRLGHRVPPFRRSAWPAGSPMHQDDGGG